MMNRTDTGGTSRAERAHATRELILTALVRILKGFDRCLSDLPAEVRAERADMARQLLVHMIGERERALADGTATARSTWDDAATGLIDALVGLWLAPFTSQAEKE